MSNHSEGSSRIALLGAAAILVAGAVVYLFVGANQEPRPSAGAKTEEAAKSAGVISESPGDDTELRAQTEEERAAATAHQPAVVHWANRPTGATGQGAGGGPNEASPAARELVSSLTNLDFSHGPISGEAAERWKRSLQLLAGQGAAAVPAIRDFLAQNQDLNFSSIGGGDQLGQSSLRSALLGALAQIGGPEATGLMVSTLQTTTVPSEIAQIAQYLDQQAPGQYRQEVVNAANDILAMAGKGQLSGMDVGPLFKVLQGYPDASTPTALDQLQGSYRYYASMALAGLPNGDGISTLVHDTQDPAAGGRADFAYQMLAQVAGQYPDAANALIEAAKNGQLSDSAWRKIATGLAGDQYQIGAPPTDPGQNSASLPGLKTYHIESGNQNFYSLPLPSDASTQSRLTLIDQLLALNPSQGALQALQQARTQLASTTPH